jgi:hypothetical protein
VKRLARPNEPVMIDEEELLPAEEGVRNIHLLRLRLHDYLFNM